MHPRSYTGLDYNPAGIEFCKSKHHLPGLTFVHGDAENLPFPDGSFDAVINVEAAHLYPDYPRFLREVARVLRPGGHFLYADLRERSYLATWEAEMASGPFRELSDFSIDDGVLRGLEKNSERHIELINRLTPKPLRRFGQEIAGALGLGFPDAPDDPIARSLEWGVRVLAQPCTFRPHRTDEDRPAVADIFPAYDDDGGLMLALTPVTKA